MPKINWDVFKTLPGAAEENFEKLCRSLIRRHYGSYGRFKQLANQPGVEFHLQLTGKCSLGEPPSWLGWQCKWYELENGKALGATRRKKIVEGIEKTRVHVPGVTDWKLWTYHTLTKSDQKWFHDLEKEQFPGLKLELLTATDIEDLLVGPGALLREAYFGELVLTTSLLADQHRLAAAPFRLRYQPEVHVSVGVEDEINLFLGSQRAWDALVSLSCTLKTHCSYIDSMTEKLRPELKAELNSLLERSAEAAEMLGGLHASLGRGQFDGVQQQLNSNPLPAVRFERLLSKLRGARWDGAPLTSNLVAYLHAVSSSLRSLKSSIGMRAFAVLAAAGGGKSELAVKLSQPDGEYPGGVLLLGKNLRAGKGLDDLVSSFKISGRPAESFDHLVEAVDAAGQRAGKRIPIIIDGLNESEDPRNWKDELFRADELLKDHPYVLLVVTLRNEFAKECLPKEFLQGEHSGFQEDPYKAIEKYFRYYKIEASEADLPIELLKHPLTLRIFCEVANADRQRSVGVEALPNSLAALFDAYFAQVAERIADLSPAANRIHPEQVQDALMIIAGLLWEANERSLEHNTCKRSIGDSRPWEASIIRALESEGVLIRTLSEDSIQGISFSYDLMAGHLMARHLLNNHSLAEWLQSDVVLSLFRFNKPGVHTFAPDVFQALVGLYPQRTGRHLWQELSDENLVLNALLLTVETDPNRIGQGTVERFSQAMFSSERFAKIAFRKIMGIRAARAHPLGMDFLHGVLMGMSNTQRDLFWTEWVRESSKDVSADLTFLTKRWRSSELDERETQRARWVMWTLTSTSRSLRDVATQALYEFASQRPESFFRLAEESISISDPYVPERMFAAAYGMCLSNWSDVSAVTLHEALPAFARMIYQRMFAPSATHPMWHALCQQYCLGIIDLAMRINPDCLPAEDAQNLIPPYSHLPNPFEQLHEYPPELIKSTKRAAIQMDFGNYTIGRLIPGRRNYDNDNKDYQIVIIDIVCRMLMLGYDSEKFESVDRQMDPGRRVGDDMYKVDRYGKKYGWIAYFEMWGVRHAQGALDRDRSARPSDADIDPTFPPAATKVELPLPSLFSQTAMDAEEWILRGPLPNYSSVLEMGELDDIKGPWVLLDGFIEQNSPNDDRQIFSFLRGVFVAGSEVERLRQLFLNLEYPGNGAIPEIPDYVYAFAGEMPLLQSRQRPTDEDISDDILNGVVTDDHWSDNGVEVEITVQNYGWESYHSVVNQGGSACLPSKRLCEVLNLNYRARQWDLHDDAGTATLYRVLDETHEDNNGQLSYIRRDLLNRYLEQSGKVLVWLIWGERGYHHRSAESRSLDYGMHVNIHKQLVVYQPTLGSPKCC